MLRQLAVWILGGMLGGLSVAGAAGVPAAKEPMRMGTAWYPEQWPEDRFPGRWEKDLQLMEQAHMNVVRVGEFAWSSMEPAEGRYEFGWLDRAIALAGKHHIAVVLGTPTAAPPAWLTKRYPETLRVENDGRRDEHGNRQQFSFASRKYRELSAGIAKAMAEHYGHNGNVIGWQLDNEISATSFDAEARQQFHEWLQKRYGTVAELNRRWATAYWSQTYDSFDEVPVHERGENPALLLEWKRFVTDTWVDYCANQTKVMRPLLDARQWITTNTMGWFDGFDHYVVHKGLDLAAWDDYFPGGHFDVARNGAAHDLVRGFKQKNFWVMETQPAFVNWGPVNSPLPPGATREAAWQAIGHGADAVLYWQWRSAWNGQEQYHGTLLGADGLPVPVYAEVQRLGEDFARVTEALGRQGMALTEFSPRSQVAIVNSYDSHWAIDFQKHSQKFDYVEQIADVHRVLQPLAGNVDVISGDAALTKYKLVFAPALNVLPEAMAENLLAYVRGGGRLVLGARSGMKDVDNGLQPKGQPGPLSEAVGGHVAQYYPLEKPVSVAGLGAQGEASVWGEALTATDQGTKVLMKYGADAGWLAEQPAVIAHTYGKGTITYVGAQLDEALLRALVGMEAGAAGVQAMVSGLPAGVEMLERSTDAGARVWIFLNHGEAPVRVDPKHEGTDLLTGATQPPQTLPGHGVMVWLAARAQ